MYISSCKERREKIKKKTNKERKKIDRPTISGNRELIICDSSFILIVHFLQYNFESYNTTIYSNDRHASRNACQIRRFIIKGGGKRGKEEKNNDAFDSLTRFLSLLSLSRSFSLSFLHRIFPDSMFRRMADAQPTNLDARIPENIEYRISERISQSHTYRRE